MEEESTLTRLIALEPFLEKKEKRTCKKEKVTENCGISILPDDCLLHIFHYLAIADKIRIERVCKRWHVISKDSWRSFKKLDCDFETWGMMRFPPKRCHSINHTVFDKVAHLCGNYLTSVCLSMQAFRKICTLTTNIRELRLFDILPHVVPSSEEEIRYEMSHWKRVLNDCNCDDTDWTEIVSWLINNSKKVTKLELSLCHKFYSEEQLSKLFLSMTSLKSFYLTDCGRMDFVGKCLENLPLNTIEEICLINVQNLDNHLLASIIRKCKKLQNICLYGLFGYEIDLIIDACVNQTKTLKNINLRVFGSFGRRIDNLPQILSNMSQLKKLEKLDLVNAPAFLNDDTLKIIANNCLQLTRLNIAGENYVTDKGIQHIANLKKITYLDISNITRIKSPPLELLKNLEVFACWKCTNIIDNCLIRLLQNADNLRAINVRQCPLVTTDVVLIANEITKTRESNKMLDFYIEPVKVPENFCFTKNILFNIAVGIFTGIKYGHENIFKDDKIPEIRIYPIPTAGKK